VPVPAAELAESLVVLEQLAVHEPHHRQLVLEQLRLAQIDAGVEDGRDGVLSVAIVRGAAAHAVDVGGDVPHEEPVLRHAAVDEPAGSRSTRRRGPRRLGGGCCSHC
jgi:hypothetical protein